MNQADKVVPGVDRTRVNSAVGSVTQKATPQILVVASQGNVLAVKLAEALRNASESRYTSELRNPEHLAGGSAACVYVPTAGEPAGMVPNLNEAESVLREIRQQRSRQLILLSSTLAYGTGPARQGLVNEAYNLRHGQPSITRPWKALEETAQSCAPETLVTILRAATLLEGASLLARRLRNRVAVTLPGRNPMIQILSPSDLARAVLAAVDLAAAGVFNVAPAGALPLNSAIRLTGSVRLPVPHFLQRLVYSREVLDFMRHPTTISNYKMKASLAVAPEKTSENALLDDRHSPDETARPSQDFDDFGMDEEFIRRCGRTWFRFLADSYWRIEATGLDHIPRQGRAVLVGTHRGFMPWDAIMALHIVVRKTGRIPRFLTHPGLFKVPFIDSFLTKLGGVNACQESADELLEREALVGIYPEGVRGAFSLLRDAYRIQPSWRNTFVRIALRHRAPIIPFVNVGSANSLPVFAQIYSRRWTRISAWPYIPVSSFPLVPVPLPSKWRLRFLPPIQLDRQDHPDAAQDSALVSRISLDVRNRMQAAIDALLGERRSVFF